MARGGIRSALGRFLPGGIGAGDRQPLDPGMPGRPAGPLIWLRATLPDHEPGLSALAERLLAEEPLATVVLSREGATGTSHGGRLLTVPGPRAHRGAARAFVTHWSPDVAIIAGFPPDRAELAALAETSASVLCVDAEVDAARARQLRRKWLQGDSLMERIGHVLAVTQNGAEALAAAGYPSARIEACGQLQRSAVPLPCNESDLSEMSRTLAARPVWLAAAAPLVESSLIARAHRSASAASHRLLLVVVPRANEDATGLAERFREAGWEVASQAEGGDIDPMTQVYLAESPEELGLWYRLSPITYLGGTLTGRTAPRSPFEPAALGSAIVSGPETGVRSDDVHLFSKGRAIRIARSADELGRCVSDLLAPDRTADLAARAWDVTSRGAEATDRVIALVSDALAERER